MPNTFDVEPWPWQPALCPADQEFIAWLLENKKAITGPVFHMGPGEHHRVGRTCDVIGVECFSMTVSEDEAFWDPGLYGYRVIVDSVNEYDFSKLPEFQVMTLFHLGEMPDRFGEPTQELLQSLFDRVISGGTLILYKGSSAWDRVSPIFTGLRPVNRIYTPHGTDLIMVIKK